MLLIFIRPVEASDTKRAAYRTINELAAVPHLINATMEKFGYPDTLAACRTIRAEAKIWMFETRF